MTSSACLALPSPSRREIGDQELALLFVGLAALPLGLLLDRRFGLPARADRALRRAGDALGRAHLALGLHAGDLSPDAVRRARLDRPRGPGGKPPTRRRAARSPDRRARRLRLSCRDAARDGVGSRRGPGTRRRRRPAVDRRRGDRGDGVRDGCRNGSGVRVRGDQDAAMRARGRRDRL